MKRLLIYIFAFIALAPSIYAQSDSTSRKNDRLSEIEAKEVPDGARKKGNEIRKKFDFGMLEYEGLGTASYKTEDYNYKKSYNFEFFINALELQYNPAQWIGVNLGMDIVWRSFDCDSCAFAIDADRHIYTKSMEELGASFDHFSSEIRVFSLAIPASLEFHKGLFTFRAGAELDLNLWGKTVTKYRQDNHKAKDVYKKAALNTVSYGLFAAISWARYGFYIKYFPDSRQILESPSPQFTNYTSIGLIFGL